MPALVNHSVSLFKNSSLAMAIGVAELTHAVKEVESQSFRAFEAYCIATVLYLVCLAADHGGRRLAGAALPHRRERAEPCSATSSTILRDNWLLLLIGQYPNGPLGGFAATLILSVLGIVLAFPLSVLLALARLSPWRAAALAGDRAGLRGARRAAADADPVGLLPGAAADRRATSRAS